MTVLFFNIMIALEICESKWAFVMKKHEKNESMNAVDREEKALKAPYASPTLRSFGTVNRLTTGTYSGTGFDGGTMRYRKWR